MGHVWDFVFLSQSSYIYLMFPLSMSLLSDVNIVVMPSGYFPFAISYIYIYIYMMCAALWGGRSCPLVLHFWRCRLDNSIDSAHGHQPKGTTSCGDGTQRRTWRSRAILEVYWCVSRCRHT